MPSRVSAQPLPPRMFRRLLPLASLSGVALIAAACSSSGGIAATTSTSAGTSHPATTIDCTTLSKAENTYSRDVAHVAAGMDGVTVGQQIATPQQIRHASTQARSAIATIVTELRGVVPSGTLSSWQRTSSTLLADYERAALSKSSPDSMQHLAIALSLTPTGLEATTSGARIGSKVKSLCPAISVPQIPTPNQAGGV